MSAGLVGGGQVADRAATLLDEEETTMYIPQHFREDRTDVLHDLIEAYSFATVVSGSAELVADHVPLLIDRARGPLRTLRGHFAKANAHWRVLAGAPALAIFQGPHAYISPTWYETPVSVPTWNYVAVHAYGRPRLVEDGAMLRALIADIVRTYEARFEGPWSMDRLPAETVRSLDGPDRWLRDAHRAPRRQVEAEPEPERRGSQGSDPRVAGPGIAP